MIKFIVILVFFVFVSIAPRVVAFSGLDYLEVSETVRMFYVGGFFDGMPSGMILAGMLDKRLIPACVKYETRGDFKNDIDEYIMYNKVDLNANMHSLIVDMLVQKCGRIRID